MRDSQTTRLIVVGTLAGVCVAVIAFSVWWIVPRWREDQERAEFQTKLARVQGLSSTHVMNLFRCGDPEMEFNVDYGPDQQLRCTPFFAKYGCYCVIAKLAKITPETASKLRADMPPGEVPPLGAHVYLSVLVYWLPRPPTNYAPASDGAKEVMAQLVQMGHAEVAKPHAFTRDFLEALSGRMSIDAFSRYELLHEGRSRNYELIWNDPYSASEEP